MINILWQELVGGGGISRPPDGALYGAKDSSLLCGAQRTYQSRAVMVTLLTHREIHFSDPSRRVWSDDPFVGGYSDATVETMIPIGGIPTCRGIALGHHIQGCVGASCIEQWTTGGHGVAWWCTVVCGTSLWSRGVLHQIESTQGETNAWTKSGHEMVQGGTTVAWGIQQYTGVCLSVQWHVEEYRDD